MLTVFPFALSSFGAEGIPTNALLVGQAPLGEQLEEGDAWLAVQGEPRHAVRVPDYSRSKTHPRLFFTQEDIPALRAKRNEEPFASMIEAMEYAATYDAGDNPSYTAGWQARNYALLYVLTGDPAHAESARQLVERLRKQDWDPAVWGDNVAPTWWPSDAYWADPDSYSRRVRHLSLTQGSLAVAVCYDWCYDAWPEAYRETISAELAVQARVQLDDWGESYPTKGYANNWRGIRFAGAGIALLACDEPQLSQSELENLAAQGINPMWMSSDYYGIDPRWLQKAYELVAAYLYSGLTDDPSARGHNVEGQGYVLYPWRLIAPFLLALDHMAGVDIRLDRPAVGWNTQFIAMGAVNIPTGSGPMPGTTRMGLRPDMADDNPNYTTQGSLALTFPFLEGDRRAAFKWHYDRFAGAMGGEDYELDWAGATWGYLYYPHDRAAVHPETAWGLVQLDRPTGSVVLRNRFHDENDTVFWVTARSRGIYNQTHYGADLGSLRIIGEGAFLLTGSGRTNRAAGQSTVLRSGNLDHKDSRYTPPGELSFVQLRENGSGSLTIEGSPTGVTGHVRRVLVDYDVPVEGPTGFYVVADDSEDGDIWRLNTPGFNTITTSPTGFTIEAPNGTRLVGTVHQPASPVIETGTFDRSGSVNWHDLESGTNRWVQIASPGNTRFVVTLQLLAPGAAPAAVTTGGTPENPIFTVGSRDYIVSDTTIRSSDWPSQHSVQVDVEPAGSGSVTGVASPVQPGRLLELSAEPAAGYVFAGWESNAVPAGGPTWIDPEYSLQVSRDIHATARFVPEEGDANHNGLPNAVEAALGRNVLTANDPRGFYAIDRQSDGSLVMTFPRLQDRSDFHYRVRYSTDLQDWTSLYDSELHTQPNTHFGRMRVESPAGGQGFLKLEVD